MFELDYSYGKTKEPYEDLPLVIKECLVKMMKDAFVNMRKGEGYTGHTYILPS